MARIILNEAYTFDDVLLRPQYSTILSREDIDISTEIIPGLKLKTPLMSSNMVTVNSVKLCIEMYKYGGIATIDQFRSIEEEVEMIKEVRKNNCEIGAAIGTSKNFMERAEAVISSKALFIVMDTPHAHNELTKKAIIEFRKKYKDFPLIVGNIATKDAAIFLIENGVDGVKIGIGPGAACLTRVNTGAGAAQVTAIMECFEVSKKYGVGLIADGGIKMPGSFAKAIAAGGNAVYMGGIFAGALESPGKVIEVNGKKYKEYFGSASKRAKEERAKKDKSYTEKSNRHIEGDSGLVSYQGTVGEVFERYTMGLKSAMSYTGAKNIKEFQDKAEFNVITQNGLIENGSHGLKKGE